MAERRAEAEGMTGKKEADSSATTTTTTKATTSEEWIDKRRESPSVELEEIKWKKETAEMELTNLRAELEMICRDRDEGKSQLKVKSLEIVEKQAKCESLAERLEEAEKKITAAAETGRRYGIYEKWNNDAMKIAKKKG